MVCRIRSQTWMTYPLLPPSSSSLFDVVYRAGPIGYKPVEEINQNETTIDHVRIMNEKSLKFFDGDGPKVLDGLTFEGGYTDVVIAGDGDFLTADTFWNFKVSKSKLQPAHALQLLMYWRMGLHSIHESYYEKIKYLGIYLEIVFECDVNTISEKA